MKPDRKKRYRNMPLMVLSQVILIDNRRVFCYYAIIVDEIRAISMNIADKDIAGFLTDFLGNMVDAFQKERCSVATFGHFILALIDKILQFREKLYWVKVILLTPTSLRTLMAHWSFGMYADKQRVVVAVALDVHKIEKVSARLAFGPQALTRPAPKRDAFRCKGFLIRLLIHVSQHENLPGVGILYDSRNESVAFFEIYIHSVKVYLYAYVNSFAFQKSFQFRNSYLTVMEYAGCQGCVGLTDGESVEEVLHGSGTATGNNRNAEV